MGFALGRDSGIFHAWICRSSHDSYTNLGVYSASRSSIREQFINFRAVRSLAVIAAYAASVDIGRKYGRKFLYFTASLFTADDIINAIYLFSESEGIAKNIMIREIMSEKFFYLSASLLKAGDILYLFVKNCDIRRIF